MKANEFVKKYGVDCAKETLKHNQDLMNIGFFIDLKRLVESHELVEEYNGLFEAKELIRVSPKLTSEMRVLAAAIADVESYK